MSEFQDCSFDYLVEELTKVEEIQYNNFKGSQLEKSIEFYLRPFENVDSSSQLYYAIERLVEKFINDYPTGVRYFISLKSHTLNLECRSQLLVKDTLFPLIDSKAIKHLSNLAMSNNSPHLDCFSAKITVFNEV